MAPSIFASPHERRSAQQRGFYRFLTWPFILFEVAVVASDARTQKLVHQPDAEFRPADATKSVAPAPRDEDPDPSESAGKSSAEDGGSAGPTPIPNPTLQSQARSEAPSGGEQGESGTSGSPQASPSVGSTGASGGGSGTSPSILMPNASGDGELDGLAVQALGFGETPDLPHALLFQGLDSLPDLEIVPAPAFLSSAAGTIEDIVAAATTPLTTIAIVPTLVEGVLGAVEEQIDADQAVLATLAFGAGQTVETASAAVTEAANIVFDGLDSSRQSWCHRAGQSRRHRLPLPKRLVSRSMVWTPR